MKVLFYDCFSGISGDMNLGAMVDIGVDPVYLTRELEKLPVSGYELKISKAIKMGIEGTRVEVKLANNGATKEKKGFNPLLLKVASEESHQHPVIHTEGHHDRNFLEIKSLIENSRLSDNVKKISIDIFRRVAEAEVKIHGKTIEEVHFHEVGAVDSIVDIVGAAICVDYLKPDTIISAPPQLGGGFVKCAHGTFPVPAPATAEILKGIPVKTGAVGSETTTPTGAAILAALCHSFTEVQEFVPVKIGYGIGYKDFSIPNVLRVYLADDNREADYISESSRLIECNMDDMSPERFGYVMDKLFEAGADDVFSEPIVMKKNRPAYKLSVLISITRQEAALDILFHETTTLGVRVLNVEKKMLRRRTETLQTKWGPVTIKFGVLNGNDIKAKPEYEDCLKIARENNLSFSQVYDEVSRLISQSWNR